MSLNQQPVSQRMPETTQAAPASQSPQNRHGGGSASSASLTQTSAAKTARTFLAITLILLLALPLMACRETDVFTEKIIDIASEVIDLTLEPYRTEAPESEQENEYNPEPDEEEEEDDNNVDEDNLLQYDESSNSNDTTANAITKENYSLNYNSSAGEIGNSDLVSNITQFISNVGSSGEQTNSDVQEESENDNSKTDEQGVSDEVDAGMVYDSTGATEDLPHGNAVAAMGEVATIVQMLAGKGGLCAADATWINKVSASAAFENEGVENLTAAWDEDGNLSVSKLIKAAPDALLIESSDLSNISVAQLEKITAAGIDVVTLPDIGEVNTLDSSILTVVNSVAEVLSQSTGLEYDVVAMKQLYVAKHDAALNDALDAAGGYAWRSMYEWGGNYHTYKVINQTDISDESTYYTSNVIYTAFADALVACSGTKYAYQQVLNTQAYNHDVWVDVSDGVAVSASSETFLDFSLISYYLQVSGVADSTALSSWGLPVKTPLLILTTALHDSSTETWDDNVSGTAQFTADSGVFKYHWFMIGFCTLWMTTDYVNLGSSAYCTVRTIGDDDFPAIVARSKKIAKAIKSSGSKTNGAYNNGQPYKVYVLPTGLDGSWADGYAESFLATVWSYSMFHGGNVTQATAYVNDFYSTFYRCQPTTTGEDGDTVLADYFSNNIYEVECPTE